MPAAAAAVVPSHPVALRLPPVVTSITRLQAAVRSPCQALAAWSIALWPVAAVAVDFLAEAAEQVEF